MTVEEHDERDVVAPEIPDYGDDATLPTDEDKLARLRKLIVGMATVKLKVDELKEQLKSAEEELKTYEEKLIPGLMEELDIKSHETRAGIFVEYKEEVRASLPENPEKRNRAFTYLRESGNDGIIKQDVTASFDRGTDEIATKLMEMIKEAGIDQHANVKREETIHHSTLVRFIKTELEEGRDIPLDAFGAFIQKIAKIKVKTKK